MLVMLGKLESRLVLPRVDRYNTPAGVVHHSCLPYIHNLNMLLVQDGLRGLGSDCFLSFFYGFTPLR